MEWNITHSKEDCNYALRYAGRSYCGNPRTADGTVCDEKACPIKEPRTNTESWRIKMRLAKETCTLCSEETGRRIGSGVNHRSMYPLLSVPLQTPVGLLNKGDTCGPVCELCYVAMDQLGMIDQSSW